MFTTNNVNATTVNTTTVNATVFGTGDGLAVSGGPISISGPNLSIGPNLTVENSTGNITTSGVIKEHPRV